MLIDSKRLIVMNNHDLTFLLHLPELQEKTGAMLELLPLKTGVKRWGYGIQYTYGSQHIYTIGGNCINGFNIDKCFKIDLINRKCI